MALPEILPPAGTPVFLAEGHGIEPQSVYADVQFGAGHSRRRRVWTRAPRVVSVSWLLEADEMAAVDDWFENTLLAGARKFSAQVANQGPGLLWWEAQWLEPYHAEAMHLGRWRVTGQLLLTGEGTPTKPYTPDMTVSFASALTGSASASIAATLALEILVPLTQPSGGSPSLGVISFVVALEKASGGGVDSCDPFIVLGSAGITLNIDQTITALATSGEVFTVCEALT